MRQRGANGRPGVPRALAALAAVSVGLAACTGDPIGTPSRPPASVALAGATAAPPASFGPPPSPTPPDDASPIMLDPDLLAFLPEAVGGSTVSEDVDGASTALTDPALPGIASAVDGAVALDGGGNLVYAWVVRLRRDAFTDADFRQWRDAYDEGACAAGGGVVGRAEAQIGGRRAFVTSCVSGMHTYHVWLQDQDILVSASSIGDGRFGELLLEGLRVPA